MNESLCNPDKYAVSDGFEGGVFWERIEIPQIDWAYSMHGLNLST